MADDEEAVQGRRTLVRLDERRSCLAPAPRPSAAFVTQLLACRDGTPAYRAHRRAEPATAVACYTATALVTRRRGAA